MDKSSGEGNLRRGKGDEGMKAYGLGCLRIQTQPQPYLAFKKKWVFF